MAPVRPVTPGSGFRPGPPTPPPAQAYRPAPPTQRAPAAASWSAAAVPPTPSSPWYARPATALVAVLVAGLAVAGGTYAVMHGQSSPSPVVAAPVESVAAEPSTGSSPRSATPTDPHSALQALADSDSAPVEGLVGSWVPQLSSKRPGLVADGQTWDDAAILAEHRSTQSTYSDARLLWTGDFANYRGRNFWATVVGEPMPTASAANAWCDAQSLDADHCYAVRLTHTGGPDGNAVMRPHR